MKLLHTSAQTERIQAGAVTCRLLLSRSLSCWLAEGEGGRGEGLKEGSPVWPVCRYIYILPAGGPGKAVLPLQPARTQPVWLSVLLHFFGTFRTKLHACQEQRKLRSGHPGGGSPPAPAVPLFAWLPCLDSTCRRHWPYKDRSTHSLAGKSANTGAARRHGEAEPP